MEKFDKFYGRIGELIKANGRTVICVGDSPPFAYTIGNSLVGMPELLCVGLADVAIMNVYSRVMLDRGRRFDDRECPDIGGLVPCCVIEAAPSVKSRYTVQATEYLRNADYDVMQIVVPDPAGLFPWQPGCLAPYSKMPIYPANPLN